MSVVAEKEPEIEIIIPNWNGEALLPCCLDSLQQQSYQRFRITVVDNGSTDNSLRLLARDYPAVRVLSFAENRGFSVAVNAGLRKARSPWVFLLNNDMEVAPDCLERVAEGIAAYPEYQFFAIKMYNYHQRDMLDGVGDAFLRGGAGYRIGIMECDSKRYSVDRPCFGACAGAAVYQRRLFEKTGYFDEDFFAYLEDVDLNLRAAMAGFQCMFLSAAKVYHMGSATTGSKYGSKFNEFTLRLSTRNSINLIVKNYPSLLFIRFLPVIVIYQCCWLLFCLKKGHFRSWCRGVYEACSLSSLRLFYRKHRLALANKGWREIWQQGNRLCAAEREAVRSIMARRETQGKGNFLLQAYLFFF